MAQVDSKRISMLGFAKVVAAEPKRKLSALRPFLQPKAEDSVGRQNYYIKALSVIRAHHRGDHDRVNELLQELIEGMHDESSKNRKVKYASNYRAAVDYLTKFGSRALDICPGKRLYYQHRDIVIGAHPDLVAKENGQLLLLKLNMTTKDYPGGVNATMLHVLHVAATNAGLDVAPNRVECVQVASGSCIRGPKTGFPPRSTLDSACRELVKLWTAA